MVVLNDLFDLQRLNAYLPDGNVLVGGKATLWPVIADDWVDSKRAQNSEDVKDVGVLVHLGWRECVSY